MRNSFVYLLCRVSIHAPREGCDCAPRLCISALLCFNSRTLGRVRPAVFKSSNLIAMFQFTHPGKGATPSSVERGRFSRGFNSRTLGRVRRSLIYSRCLSESFNSRTLGRVRRIHEFFLPFPLLVSIHAPWEGCDYQHVFLVRMHDEFQFTHPGKGATRYPRAYPAYSHQGFNSRTLGRVRPKGVDAPKTSALVSIHAPWEGCDYNVQLYNTSI